VLHASRRRFTIEYQSVTGFSGELTRRTRRVNRTLQGSDHRQDALTGPENGYRDAARGNGQASKLPSLFAQTLNETKQRPGNQNDYELADLDSQIEGEQALPDIGRCNLKNLVQDE